MVVMKWLIAFVLGFTVLGIAFAGGYYLGKRYEGYRINRVVDGDTLGVTDLRTGRDWRMRLWGIDAPEARECGAKESKEELERLVGGRSPKILILGVDGFGRLVGRVWINREEVVGGLVADGWARVDSSRESVDKGLEPDLAVVGELRRAEEKAKAAKLGMWGPTCVTVVTDVDG